jgi:hypothetical protein
MKTTITTISLLAVIGLGYSISEDLQPFKAKSTTISPYSIREVYNWNQDGGFWLFGQGSDKKVYYWSAQDAQWRLYRVASSSTSTLEFIEYDQSASNTPIVPTI